MGVAESAASAFRHAKSLARFCKVKKKLVCFGVENLCADGNFNDRTRAFVSGAIRTFAVSSALGLVFGIVSKMQECIETFVRFQPDIATATAIAARRSTARNKLFAAKSCDAISAITRLYTNFYPIDEHF
jgi:hypothetical protein